MDHTVSCYTAKVCKIRNLGVTLHVIKSKIELNTEMPPWIEPWQTWDCAFTSALFLVYTDVSWIFIYLMQMKFYNLMHGIVGYHISIENTKNRSIFSVCMIGVHLVVRDA